MIPSLRKQKYLTLFCSEGHEPLGTEHLLRVIVALHLEMDLLYIYNLIMGT